MIPVINTLVSFTRYHAMFFPHKHTYFNMLGQNTHHLLGYSSGFELFQRESTSSSLLDIVSKRRAPYNRPKCFQGPWSNSCSLFSPRLASTIFPGGLVEPCLNISIPVFVKVRIRHHLIALSRHLGALLKSTPIKIL